MALIQDSCLISGRHDSVFFNKKRVILSAVEESSVLVQVEAIAMNFAL